MEPDTINTIRLVIGQDEDGDTVSTRLAQMPHMLVAGMTGSGKSMFIHNILCQLIAHPDSAVGLVLIDPKRVEFSRYVGLPHLVDAPVYDEDRIRTFLEWTVNEMYMRFDQMEKNRWYDIEDQRERVRDKPWSRLVVVIDELANLILSDRSLEKPIVKLASMGRAAGIHLILATQRPSADVVTGLIRANVPTRVCLPVVTKMESRIILDKPGAELLEHPGEILARLPGKRELVRLRSQLLPDHEIDRLKGIAMILAEDD